MTTYESWSLALTAIGHLFVGASVLYAARQWVISKQSHKREIVRDTRRYLSEISARIHGYQREIIEKNLDPANLNPSGDDSRPVVQLLNTLESVAYETETDFYDRSMLDRFLTAHSAQAWFRWQPFVLSLRSRYGRNSLWSQVERMALRYNQ